MTNSSPNFLGLIIFFIENLVIIKYQIASMLHNLALYNLWSIKDPNVETMTIHNEFKELEKKPMKQLNEEYTKYSENLIRRKFQKEDGKSIIQMMLYSLSFETGNIFNVTKAVLFDEYKGKGLETLLALGEICLSFNEKSYKEVILFFQ